MTDMDGGPFRVPRQADRRATSRPEPTRSQVEGARVINESEVAYRAAEPRQSIQKSKSPKRWLISAIILLVIAALSVAGWMVWNKTQHSAMEIDSSKYQAVFFTNGQVYFGKLQAYNGEYIKLKDIYYLQTQASEEVDQKNPQQTSTAQNGVQLIKLGDEVHGPEDEMVISKSQVLFYENLKSDGTVAQSIEKHKSGK